MTKYEERLKPVYESWETEDLMKAVTIERAQYEPIAIDLMIEEIKKRNLSDNDIDNYLNDYRKNYLQKIPNDQLYNFVLQGIRAGADKWTIAKRLAEKGMDRQKALDYVATIQAQEQIYNFVLQGIRAGADKWTIAKSLTEKGMDRQEALDYVATIQAQVQKIIEEQLPKEPIVVEPFKESERDIRPLVASIFLPGLYICLFLSAIASLVGAGFFMYIAYKPHIIRIIITALIGIGGVIGAGICIHAAFKAVRKAVVNSCSLRITREQAPKLFDMVSTLCREMEASPPDNIILELGTNFFVTDADVITFDGQYDSQTLCISAPLLHVLNLEELKSIIAHELAHFTGDDLVYSRKFYPVYRGTLAALKDMEKIESRDSDLYRCLTLPLLVPMGILRSYLKAFSKIERRISRRRELRADSLAAKASSSPTMASALVKVYTYGLLWGQHLEEWVVEALNEGKAFTNISDLFVKVFTPEESLLKEIAQDSTSCLTHPTDTHPSLKDRLAALGEEQIFKLGIEVESAAGLFPDLASLEEKLTEVETSLIVQHHPGVDKEKLHKSANGG